MDGDLQQQQPGIAASSSYGRPFQTMVIRDTPGSCIVPDSLSDSLARQLSAQLSSSGRISTDRSPCLLPSPSPPAAVSQWEGAAVAASGAVYHGTGASPGLVGEWSPGGSVPASLLLSSSTSSGVQQRREFKTAAETMSASSGAVTGEDGSAFLAASSRIAGHPTPATQQQPMGLAYSLQCAGRMGSMAPLLSSDVQADVVRFVVDEQGHQRMRRDSALDLQAPPGYESIDLSVAPSLEARPVAEQDVLIQEFNARSRIGFPASGEGTLGLEAGFCGQQPQPDFARRRSSTLSPSSQTARDRAAARKGRSQRTTLDTPSPSVESAASAPPVSFTQNTGGRDGMALARSEPLENEKSHDPVHMDVGLSMSKLQGEVRSFVSILYDSVFNSSPTWQVPMYTSAARGVHTPQLPDVVVTMHSPWCTRKQWLDPQLVGGRPLEHPVFDQGTGHADALRQLTALKSCIGDFAVTVECVQACVAGPGRLSCALRGTLVAPGLLSRDPEVNEPGRDGHPQAPKMGRFAHFLTLIPKHLNDDAADPSGDGSRNTVPTDPHPWILVARSLYFLIESEMFVAINASEGTGGAAHISSQVVSGHSLLCDADLSPGIPNGFEAPLSVPAGRGSRSVGQLQELAEQHVAPKNTPLSCLSLMLKPAIALGHDRGVPLPGKARGSLPSCDDLPTGAECMKAAVAQLATGLLADSPTRNQQHMTGSAAWTAFMHNPAPRQRRSRKKKKSRQAGTNASDPETQLLSSSSLSAVVSQSASFQLPATLQLQSFEQQAMQDRRDDLLSLTSLPSKGILTLPGSQGVPPDAFERTVFVSWIPRAARAQEHTDKEEAEEKLKTVLSSELGICGIERVLVFPPRGSHCCITFFNSEASMAFLLEYAGGTFTPNTEKFKKRICASFNVEFDRGIQRVFIRIEGVKLMPPAGRAADTEPKS
ncbi:hypothetical protein, conserved [Eimeria tenella]|uniref:Uncharacterized protein n=1 Tax=Eimeria tenella TaxID=5802 RepID=U6KWQ8_EIMTE|nr:hypothetical protein, conserved [Eimeria tenella]CDJ41368.1 hypothetical protein, conserved [Eimeria tenella]|eukprot:XP_013232118.1 hypothetical protein, conserved [Eimeria tenella]